MKKVEVFFDGGIRPFPSGGYARCYGWMIKSEGETIEGRGIEVDERDVGSCVVEIEALARALQNAAEHAQATDDIVVHGDSRAVINMCSGLGVPQDRALLNDVERVKALASQFQNIQFAWIPRELNSEADKLGRVAFAEHSSQDVRMTLMNDVNAKARRIFGKFYDNAVMGTWCATVTGKRKLSKMSVGELNKLLAHVCHIPNFIRDYVNGNVAVVG